MAVKSIRLADAASGNRIQVVEASEVDDSSNATVMERVVSGTAKLPTSLGNATRGSGSYISAAESVDLTALPADLTGNLIVCGDSSIIEVFCDMTANGTVTVTPIIFDGQTVPVAVCEMESRTFSKAYAFRRGAGSGDYTAPCQVWDTRGAVHIGLHVSAVSSGNTCKLWGRVI